MATNVRTVVVVLIVLFIVLSPEPQPPVSGQRRYGKRIHEQERAAFEVFRHTRYGDFNAKNKRFLNLTGLGPEFNYAWDRLDIARQHAKEQTSRILGQTAALDGQMNAPIPVFHNVSGYVTGPWVRPKWSEGLRAPHINLSAIMPEGTLSLSDFGRNISRSSKTSPRQSVRLRLIETANSLYSWNSSVRDIRAEMSVYDDTTLGDWWEMTLHGVHFMDFGGIILTTTSDKFAGIFALPHFALSEYTFSLTHNLLNRTLNETIAHRSDSHIQDSNPWSSTGDVSTEGLFSQPQCEYVVYLQQHPRRLENLFTSPVDQALYLKFVEDELRFPTGARIPSSSEMIFSMIAFSPDCGFIISSKDPREYAATTRMQLRGPKLEAWIAVARRHILVYAAILCGQILLLIRQMKEASTPSMRNRISFYTITMLSLGDAFALLAFVVFGIMMDSVLLAVLATAFMAFLSVILFGMRFLLEIWTVQATEARRQERQAAAAAAAAAAESGSGLNDQSRPNPDQPQHRAQPTMIPAPTIHAAGSDTLPLPVTARRPSDTGITPIIIPSDQDVDGEIADNENTNNANGNRTSAPSRRELSWVYSRFWLIVLFVLFTSIHAFSWPTLLRSAYCNIISFVYVSFWCPQIYRNIMRNCRRALRWDFVVGHSILRLLPLVYFYGYAGNVLFVDTDWESLSVIAGWVWIQVCVLVSQWLLGPRFLMSESWLPPAYDYHPILREDEEGAKMPIGFSQAAEESLGSPTGTKHGESRDKGKKVFDCCICMQDIEVPIVPAGGLADGTPGMRSGILARRAYMVTPCRHIFHTPCLEGWMRYRLQCPMCRETLPPL